MDSDSLSDLPKVMEDKTGIGTQVCLALEFMFLAVYLCYWAQ